MSNSIIDIMNGIIFDSSNQSQIAPSWIANLTYKDLDPDNIAPVRVKMVAIQQLKQIARQQLRGKFEPDNPNDALQHKLFPGLQDKYPVQRSKSDDEPLYVKLELLTSFDIDWNVHRLRSEAGTKMKHADALEQWAFEHQRKAA